MIRYLINTYHNFYPRSPYGERLPAFSYSRPLTYFYPRSPYGERLQRPQAFRPSQHFYPRSPYGERPSCAASAGSRLRFLSTLSLRRATAFPGRWLEVVEISIHALLTESDRAWPTPTWATLSFLSTLSLRRATTDLVMCSSPASFLSTLSLRRATSGLTAMWCRALNFYPRSPYGERRAAGTYPGYYGDFYPRSPYGERPISAKTASRAFYFYPRSPYGERPMGLDGRFKL